jgi:hypothetical protein
LVLNLRLGTGQNALVDENLAHGPKPDSQRQHQENQA